MASFNIIAGDRNWAVSPKTLLVAGFTGRNPAIVRAHILELEREGVTAPTKVPAYYEVPPSLLTTSSAIVVDSLMTSGEAEAVIIRSNGKWLVTVGSDHTDRDLERIDISQSKAACPKVIAAQAWELAEVSDHWDALLLRSWVDGQSDPYQEGALSSLMPPDEILSKADLPSDADVVVFLGTLPLSHELRYGSRFAVELEDPTAGRRLRSEYEVSVQPT